jgi:hypothetical protein
MKRASQTILNQTKSYQRESFEKLKGKFQSLLEKINIHDSDLITPFWKNINIELSRRFCPHPPFGFLTEPEIAGTMFSTNIQWANNQLAFLEGRYSNERLGLLLDEQLIGDPLILTERYNASCNTIHHLYHLTNYLDNTSSTSLNSVHNILELGGGYGRLPILFNRFSKRNYVNYTILDIPIFVCIQWLYLSCVYGEELVNVVTRKDDDPKAGAFNLIPITLAEHFEFKPDLFVAMWSLSETSPECLKYILKTDMFGANKVFMGFHGNPSDELPSGQPLKQYCTHNMTVVPVDFIGNNYYGIK